MLEPRSQHRLAEYSLAHRRFSSVSQRQSFGPPPLRLPNRSRSSSGSPQHRIGRMANNASPATSVVISSSLPLWFSRDERSVALFLLEASITGSDRPLGVSRRAAGASAPHAKRDQAESEQHGGKQGGKGGRPNPENEWHPQQGQERRARSTAHRGGQPCRQQRQQPRPASSSSDIAGGDQPGRVPEVETHQNGEYKRGGQAPPGRGQPDVRQRLPHQERCERRPGVCANPDERCNVNRTRPLHDTCQNQPEMPENYCPCEPPPQRRTLPPTGRFWLRQRDSQQQDSGNFQTRRSDPQHIHLLRATRPR